ncbi:MAG: gluconolaconase [Alphaproteobacteria bacterium HGW-Alphaproteobacteria-13]|jgi:sugar lactone lactonase YvrE|nr:MAG: gluconolaconase [Alphaproteobacteria bacterium HGW-Alphaproteobacteria-13]
MDIQPRCLLPIEASLGEGPVWVSRDRALWFVDILAALIHRFEPDTGRLGSWTAPARPGWIHPSADGGFLVGLKTGLHRFDPGTGAFEPLFDPEPHLFTNRLNDAAVDHAGRLWFGTMDDDETAASGRFYRLDQRGCAALALPPVMITNGPAISPDGRFLYPVDTISRQIFKVPLAEDGRLGPASVLVTIEEGAGWPDGPVCDAEGCLWVGLFAGWAARRYSPAGRLLQTVEFPVANVTKIAFGDPDLRTAFATTARKGLDEAALAGQPLAGGLFAFDPGVAGFAAPVADPALRFGFASG